MPAPSAEAIEEEIPVVHEEVESSSDADDIEEVHQEIQHKIYENKDEFQSLFDAQKKTTQNAVFAKYLKTLDNNGTISTW